MGISHLLANKGINMALINCPACTQKISDQSVSCTNCGLPTSKMKLLINCPECSEFTSSQGMSCTNCGFPTRKPTPFKDIQPSSEELKEIKLLKKLEEAGEPDDHGFFNHTNMFIISCIIIYFIAKEDIHNILQHIRGLF